MSLGRKTAKRFMLASLVFLLAGVVEGLMQPTKFVFKDVYCLILGLEPQHIKPFFGYFVSKIHTHITLVGWVSTGLMGVFYFLAEEIRGGHRYRSWLCRGNLFLQVVGVLVLAIGFHLIGITAVPTGHPAGSPEFRAAAQGVKPVVVAGGVLLLLSCLAFIYNIGATLTARGYRLMPRDN
jgi:heme/copper-type cytochrome/quinol oxidase subunit 1